MVAPGTGQRGYRLRSGKELRFFQGVVDGCEEGQAREGERNDGQDDDLMHEHVEAANVARGPARRRAGCIRMYETDDLSATILMNGGSRPLISKLTPLVMKRRSQCVV